MIVLGRIQCFHNIHLQRYYIAGITKKIEIIFRIQGLHRDESGYYDDERVVLATLLSSNC